MRKSLILTGLILLLAFSGCVRSTGAQTWRPVPNEVLQGGQAAPLAENVTQRDPNAPILTPTPDPPRVLPTPRMETEQYVIQRNDTLDTIAQRYGISLGQLLEVNNIPNPDIVEVGTVLVIPPSQPRAQGPGFKVIPDSELVYSPGSVNFDLGAFLQERDSYITRYEEELDGRTFSGPEVIMRVVKEYSVNPRLLLAVLEYRGRWISQANPSEESKEYPVMYFDPRRKGLYRQLAWAANNLNRGYYLWRADGLSSWLTQDGAVVPVNPTINAGTAGVQNFLSLVYGYEDWINAVGENGLFATYTQLFGYPFDYAIEPLVPPGLQQPLMQLPFEPGQVWSYTGGPHGGWADGSAWAAIDFAPPGEALGCVQNDAWTVAVADGLIVRADLGAVVQDLDGDGLEQTGWTVLYMHTETRDRVQPGTYVKAGERIGHPSCEGGVSTGTHLHLARRYNGEWISSDRDLPFNLDGWISAGAGGEYDGYLIKDGVTVEAWVGRHDENAISR